jgi:hypothetical protein
LKIDEVLSTSMYKGVLPDINNDSISAHLFETTINGDLSWIIVRLTPEGIARLYSITDSDKMIGLIKKITHKMVAPQGTAILVTHHNVVYLTKLNNNF